MNLKTCWGQPAIFIPIKNWALSVSKSILCLGKVYKVSQLCHYLLERKRNKKETELLDNHKDLFSHFLTTHMHYIALHAVEKEIILHNFFFP